MGKRSKNIRNRLLVGILSLAMLLTGVTVPTGTEKAQAAEITLSAESGSSFSGTVNLTKNEYGPGYISDIYFDIPTQARTKSALESNGIKSIEVKVTVTDFSVSSGTPVAMIFAQPGEDGKWNWNESKEPELQKGQQLTLTYDFSNMDWNGGTSFGHLGLRFSNTPSDGTVSYTINSAKLITDSTSGGTESGSGTGSGSGDAATAEQLKGISIELNTLTNNPDWSEYNFTIKNNTSEALERFIIKVPVLSGKVDNLQSFGGLGSATYTDGAIFINFTKAVPANGSYTCPNDAKFGFGGGGAVLGTPVAIEDDGTYTPSNKLNYEITGKPKENVAFEDTPVGKHGKLRLQKVDGYPAPVIVDESGNPYQLRGASTHGMQWFPEYVNEDAFRVLRDEWGVNMVRLASYVTQYNGYTNGGKEILDSKIIEGVEAAKKLGLYAIVDWHIHEENPNSTKATAREFFKTYAAKYKDYDNVIFEICNEPTETPWYNGSDQDIYNYANEMCGIIRDAGSEAIIVCGTNTWSQDVHEVKGHTIDAYDNIMYTFHFYAGTHGEDLRNRVKTVSEEGLPIFVTEFGVCAASGNGGYDTANADKWIELCDKYNISYACWSFCNKAESASYLLSSCNKTTGGWTADDLTETGFWLINTYRAHQDIEDGTDTKKPGSGSSSGGGSQGGGSQGGDSQGGGSQGGDSQGGGSQGGDSQGGDSQGGDSQGGGSQGGDSQGGGSQGGDSQGGGSQGGDSQGGGSQGGDSQGGGSQGGGSSQGGGGSSQTPGSTDAPGSTSAPNASQKPQASDLPATGTVEGVITDTNTAIDNNWSGADAELAKKSVLSQNGDKDIAGSTFGGLKLRATKTTKNSVKLKWASVKGASKYVVYGNRCGSAMEELSTVTGTGWTHSGLQKGTYYKYVVVACQTVSGADVSLSISKMVHATTLGGKKGNAKKVTVKKAKVKLKKKKSFKIKAKQIPLKKKNKIASHRKISYESSNKKIATVSSSGKIKAKKKGKCNIYVYAQNGIYKQVKVTVK